MVVLDSVNEPTGQRTLGTTLTGILLLCVNSNDLGSYRYFELGDLDKLTYDVDKSCGAYMPDYVKLGRGSDSDELFDKCASGDPDCRGCSRSDK